KGLPGSGRIVGVGPPLFASGSRSGSIGVTVPAWLLSPVSTMFGSLARPMRLLSPPMLSGLADVVNRSGRTPPVFFATTVLSRPTEGVLMSANRARPPPWVAAVLLAIVLLLMVNEPLPLIRIAPPIAVPAEAELPASVLLLIVTRPLTKAI